MRIARVVGWSAGAFLAASLGCGSSTDVGGGAVPGDIVVVPGSVGIAPLGSQQLAVWVLNDSGQLIVGVPVTFRSVDTTIVSVSATGLVCAVGRVGQTTVIVESPPASRSVPVTVFQQATRLEVTPPAVRLQPGDSAQLTATARDAGGAVVVGAPVSFTTDNLGVATVSSLGLVRAVGGFGQATIAARSGVLSATATVRVEPPDSILKSITLPGRAFGIDVSSSGVVYATLLDLASVARISLTALTLQNTFAVGVGPTGVAFSPSGTRAYVTNQFSRALGVVAVATDTQTDSVPVNADPFVTLASPDGSRIIVTGNSDSVFVVNASTLAVEGSLYTGFAPNGLAFNATGTRLYVSNSFGGTVREVDPATRTILRTFDTGGYPQGLALSADGNELYIANEFGWLGVYSLVSGSRLDSIPLAGGGFGLARSPDNAVLYVGLPQSGMVQIISRAGRRVVKTLQTGGTPRRIAFTSDSHRAVIANESGWVDVVAR